MLIDKQAAGLVFEECDAEAICMVIGDPAAGREAGERKRHIGRGRTVHSEKLAHGVFYKSVIQAG